MTARRQRVATAETACGLSRADAQAIAAGTHGDPFSLLGPHPVPGGFAIRVLAPDADRVRALRPDGSVLATLEPLPGAGSVFCGFLRNCRDRPEYRLELQRGTTSWQRDDAYRFGPVLGTLDEHLLGEGAHHRLWQVLGAHVMEHEGEPGIHFAVWAPNAQRVSVVADFNGWDGRRHVMRARGATGVWEIFVPGVVEGTRYKYEIRLENGAILPLKADPVGFGSEHPPATASVVRRLDSHRWQDAEWMDRRREAQSPEAPISIYEVHLGSWRRVEPEGGRVLGYGELAEQLVAYARDMGFTHLELLPVSEPPLRRLLGLPAHRPVCTDQPVWRHGRIPATRRGCRIGQAWA